MKNNHHCSRLRMVALATAGLFYSIYASAAYSTSFGGLGYLAGGFDSGAWGVSADGSVIVGYSTSASGTEAFRWTRSSGMTGLGYSTSSGTDSWAWGVSADGSVVAGSSKSTSGTTEAVRWSSSSGMTGLGNFSGGTFSLASDISADGNVIVGYGETGSGIDAFRWTSSGGMVNIGNRIASGISGDGNVIVGQDDGATAFRLPSSGGLGDLPGGGTTSAANAASADGSVIVGFGSSFNGTEAFVWTSSSGTVGLGANAQTAHAVSADGRLVGGGGPNGAFIWDGINGTRLLKDVLTNESGLDLTGWTLEYATGISADGSTIIGFGTNPNGYTEAWAANLSAVPIPATFWLFGSGLFGLFGIARKKSLAHQNN